MDLKAYLTILWRRKWIILLTTFLATGVAFAGTFYMTATYSATATLRISADGTVGYGDLLYAQRLMNTYPAIVKSAPALAQVSQQLRLKDLPEIDVEFPSESQLLYIIVKSENPAKLAEVANLLAEILIAESRRTREGRTFAINFLELATPPTEPDGTSKVLIIGLGAFVGLAGGLGLAFLFDNLDTTLYSIEAIERVTHLITLAQIPQIKRRRKAQYITCLSNNSPQGEAFRRLRTNLLIPATRQDNLYQTLLMVSAEPAEGKSTIVANLAQSVAQSGRKVVAIDADMRLPTLHEILELPNKIGLSNVLRQEVPLSEALQQAPNLNLHVLTSGPIPSDPAELLDSCNLIALIDQLRDQFDLILIDSPALLAVADASILASVVDKVALVARRTKIKAEALAEACHQLETINAPMMGVIVNQSEMQRHYTYYYRKPALSN